MPTIACVVLLFLGSINAGAQDIPLDWDLEVPHFYPRSMAEITRGLVAITSDEDGHPTRIVGGNLDLHKMMGLGPYGDPDEYINTDIENFQQGNATCVYIARQTRNYQQVEKIARAVGSNEFIEMYRVELECFDRSTAFEQKFQLYQADSGGRMIDGMRLSLLSKYRSGSEGYDAAAWRAVYARLQQVDLENQRYAKERADIQAGKVYHVGHGVTPPVLVYSVDAAYSKEARAERISGVAAVVLVVDTRGLPENVHIVRSLGHGLDESAMNAVRQYRFKPSTFNGQPVPVEVTIQVNFHIQR